MRTLTEEDLRRFGPGDQFHVFFPEDEGLWIVGVIDRIEMVPRENNNQEFKVHFVDTAVTRKGEDRGWTATNIGCYSCSSEEEPGPVLDELVVAVSSDDYLQIPNTGAEQILMFVKAGHTQFVEDLRAA